MFSDISRAVNFLSLRIVHASRVVDAAIRRECVAPTENVLP